MASICIRIFNLHEVDDREYEHMVFSAPADIEFRGTARSQQNCNINLIGAAVCVWFRSVHKAVSGRGVVSEP